VGTVTLRHGPPPSRTAEPSLPHSTLLRGLPEPAGRKSPSFRTVVSGSGQPAKQLAKLAERIDADLIVLGSRGHSPLAGVMLGSVTQQLLHETGRPVLALPPARVAQRRAAQLQRRRTSVAVDQSPISRSSWSLVTASPGSGDCSGRARSPSSAIATWRCS
jgi:hypothetical protein